MRCTSSLFIHLLYIRPAEHHKYLNVKKSVSAVIGPLQYQLLRPLTGLLSEALRSENIIMESFWLWKARKWSRFWWKMDDIKNSNSRLRIKWRDYWTEYDRIQERYKKWYWEECARLSGIWREEFKVNLKAKIPIFPPPFANAPPFPDELIGLTWGAKTRAGTPCKLTSLYQSGRCKFHGFKLKNKRTPWRPNKRWHSKNESRCLIWGHRGRVHSLEASIRDRCCRYAQIFSKWR